MSTVRDRMSTELAEIGLEEDLVGSTLRRGRRVRRRRGASALAGVAVVAGGAVLVATAPWDGGVGPVATDQDTSHTPSTLGGAAPPVTDPASCVDDSVPLFAIDQSGTAVEQGAATVRAAVRLVAPEADLSHARFEPLGLGSLAPVFVRVGAADYLVERGRASDPWRAERVRFRGCHTPKSLATQPGN